MFFFTENNSDVIFNPLSIESAYLLILNEDLNGASIIFENIDSPRAKWGMVLVGVLRGYTETVPSYFEIRNFLEIDLDFLLKNNKINYVEQLLGALEFLVEINQETYKFAARVMLENRFLSAAKKYLDKSKSIFYKDPELHFLYSKYFILTKKYNLAKRHILECLKILPEYYPAKKMLKMIEELI